MKSKAREYKFKAISALGHLFHWPMARSMIDRTDSDRLTLRAEQESHARRLAGDIFALLKGESYIQEGWEGGG